jgi:hypothetical protein
MMNFAVEGDPATIKNESQIRFQVENLQEIKSNTKSDVHVLNDAGFMNTYAKRANDDFWKTVNSV